MATCVVEGLDTNEEVRRINCNLCVETKQSKSPAVGKLAKGVVHHVVHSDMIGLVSPQTVGGARYIVRFIVESSRYSKEFILQNRSEVNLCFLEFQLWIERNTGVLVKQGHSENAKEYKDWESTCNKQELFLPFRLLTHHSLMVLQNVSTALFWIMFDLCFNNTV